MRIEIWTSVDRPLDYPTTLSILAEYIMITWQFIALLSCLTINMAEYPDNKYSSCSYIEPILAVSDLALLASSREVKLKGESRMSATCTYFRIVIKNYTTLDFS